MSGLFGVDGQNGKSYAEFSAAVDSGDRTTAQAVSIFVEGPRAAGGIRCIYSGLKLRVPSDDE